MVKDDGLTCKQVGDILELSHKTVFGQLVIVIKKIGTGHYSAGSPCTYLIKSLISFFFAFRNKQANGCLYCRTASYGYFRTDRPGKKCCICPT